MENIITHPTNVQDFQGGQWGREVQGVQKDQDFHYFQQFLAAPAVLDLHAVPVHRVLPWGLSLPADQLLLGVRLALNRLALRSHLVLPVYQLLLALQADRGHRGHLAYHARHCLPSVLLLQADLVYHLFLEDPTNIKWS